MADYMRLGGSDNLSTMYSNVSGSSPESHISAVVFKSPPSIFQHYILNVLGDTYFDGSRITDTLMY